MSNAGAGVYHIKVRSKTAGSDYGPVAALVLRIKEPFWGTWWFALLCFVVAAFVVYLVVRYAIARREKAHLVKIGLLKSEFKAMNALMNPHLVFNVLNNVRGLIDSGDRSKANEYLQTLSTLMRQNMLNVSRELIPLQKELELLRNYLKIEELRYPGRFSYNIVIGEDVDPGDVLVPPLLIQPLVENALLHGILPTSRPGTVNVRISATEDYLTIVVEDDGVGIGEPKEVGSRVQESFGLRNIRNRISQLSEMRGRQATFTIVALNDGRVATGTLATITIPF